MLRIVGTIVYAVVLMITLVGSVMAQTEAFTDVTSIAGVAGGSPYGSNSVSWGDYNNDGYLDLYVLGNNPVHSGHNLLYRNEGNGTFTDWAYPSGITNSQTISGDNGGCPWADYDNDGWLDIWVSQYYGAEGLFHNNGDGTFTNVTSDPDVGIPSDLRSKTAFWGDYNNDGHVDLYVVGAEVANHLYRNNGNGTFTDVASFAGVAGGSNDNGNSGSWVDYDNDGDLDLYVGNYLARNYFYENNGDGKFTDITYLVDADLSNGNGSRKCYGIAWGDYNNDGYLDLYVSNASSASYLYRNNGNGTFTDVTSQAGGLSGGDTRDVTWIDYNNDGYLDLYLGSHNPSNSLFRNNGDHTFTNVSSVLGVSNVPDYHWSCAWGDYNNDGYPDLYLAAAYAENANRLLKNDCSGNNWLGVKTVGTVSNKAGIGARVECLSGGLLQVREVSAGANDHQDSLPVEFGLGSNLTVDSLIVRWPSGIKQELSDIDANQFLTVVESDPNQPPDVPPCSFSSIESNFNGTPIAEGNYIWFNCIMKVKGVGDDPVTITFTPSASMATTEFSNGMWQTEIPLGFSKNILLSGLSFPVPPGGLPGGINPVTWSGQFASDSPSITIEWKWAAAVYTVFGSEGELLVKPVDGDKLNPYPNSDHAGTPENFKEYVIGGARGGGGSNYTGSYSGTGKVNCLCSAAPPLVNIQIPERYVETQPVPDRTILLNCYPIPANPDVWIPYQLGSDSHVVIRIHDTAARLIRKLDIGQQPAGYYVSKGKAAHWDGSNEAGEPVASGIYFCTIEAGSYTATEKLTILK